MALTGSPKTAFLKQRLYDVCYLGSYSYMNKVSEAFLTSEQNHKLKKRYVFAQRELSDMLSIGIYTV